MEWDCPYARSHDRCRLFDGPCEPGSQGCLLAGTPCLALPTGEEEPAERPSSVQPVPWPTLTRRRLRNTSKEGRRRATRTLVSR
jgi:hypothetical protein